MAPIVVYDACVLVPATLRDLMLRLAAAGLVQPRGSTGAGTTLPDADDVRVLATAPAAGASSIVTFNLRRRSALRSGAAAVPSTNRRPSGFKRWIGGTSASPEAGQLELDGSVTMAI